MYCALSIVPAIVILGYCYIKFCYSYWARRNVLCPKPKFPYGNIKDVGVKIHPCHLMQKYYDQFKNTAPFCGLYFLHRPAILCLNLEFVKIVLAKDFQYFHDRGMYYNKKNDPLSAHLVALDGNDWKNMRPKLSPTFSSCKIKKMFSTLATVADQFRDCLHSELKMNSEIEMKELLARFTTDVIGSCAFGLDCNSLKDPKTKFLEMGTKAFDQPRFTPLFQIVVRAFRDVPRFFKCKVIPEDVSEFFLGIVKDTIEYRETNKVHRNDFMDLLIDLKNNDTEEGLTVDEIAAQAFAFFLGGFETSSTTMAYALYELSLNEELQNKARKCVQDVLKRHNGCMTYDAMAEMTYIDQCVNESLRKYPPVSNLFRRVSSSYEVIDLNVTLPENMIVTIPVYGIHHDKDIYPNPELYDPDRFTPENSKNRNPYAFLPFGAGARNCIGLRFGMMQAKIGLAVLLNNFKFTRCSKSVVPLVILKRSFILTTEDGLWLKIERV